MTVPNQIDHRRNFYAQKAAGKIADPSVGRHGRAAPFAARLQAPKKQPKKDGKELTLAERLGIQLPDPVPAKPTITPNANVEATAKPEVRVDPKPADEGALPPIPALNTEPHAWTPPAPAPELPALPRSWVDTPEETEDEEAL